MEKSEVDEDKKSNLSSRKGKLDMSLFEIKLTRWAHLRTATGPPYKPKDRLVIVFSREQRASKAAMLQLAAFLKESNLAHNVLVLAPGKPTPFGQRVLTKLQKRYNLQIFLHEELLVNVTQHKLVKPHVRIEGKEKQQMMERYYIKDEAGLNQLPKIALSDPIVRYYNFREGDVIRIDQPASDPTYRLVALV